jgi:putative transcriptional regulator
MLFDSVFFGARVKAFRKAAKMTQAELGAALGVGNTAIANLESGKYNPSLDVLFGLTEVFKVTLAELVGETEAVAKAFQPWIMNLLPDLETLDKRGQESVKALVRGLKNKV